MMKSVYKFLLFAAASELNNREIKVIREWLLTSSPEEINLAIKQLRKYAVHAAKDGNKFSKQENHLFKGSAYSGDSVMSSKDKPRTKPTVVEDVVRLLRHEAGLTVKEASRLLLIELSQDIGLETLPPIGKESFQKWLEKIMRTTSQSHLLHVATQIRNHVVHEPHRDWPLRYSGKNDN